MKTTLLVALFALSNGAFADDGWTHYGSEFTLSDAPITSVDLLKNPAQFDGKTILVEGRVVNQISVDSETRQHALVALDRMPALV